MSYSRRVLEGHDSHLLVSLCRKCHEWAEFYRGRKVKIGVANRRLGKLAYAGAIDRSKLPRGPKYVRDSGLDDPTIPF